MNPPPDPSVLSFPVSLVIPVRNEGASLPGLLQSIAAQTWPPSEVVFVDGGSRGRALLMLHEAARNDPRLRILEVHDATSGKGRNLGIAAAAHDWIALTDAGIKLEPSWLEHLVNAARADAGADLVFGNYEPRTESFFLDCAAIAYVAPVQQRQEGRMRVLSC